MIRGCFWILGVMALLLASTEAAEAQRIPGQKRVPKYQSRSTISPYVNLFQGNNGGMNSYFSWVRPQMQMEQFVRNTSRQAQTQQYFADRQAMELQQSIEEATEQGNTLQLRPTPGATMRRPAASYMNYSAFYPRAGVIPAGSRR